MTGLEGAEVFGARRTSFGAYAATYDAVRPEWPAKTVAWMLGSPTISTSLGALPEEVAGRISTLAGGAEDIPVENGSVDAVTVFQAWHWFDAEAAAAECARVLRPGGWLSMGWHHRSEDVTWSLELSDIVERRGP